MTFRLQTFIYLMYACIPTMQIHIVKQKPRIYSYYPYKYHHPFKPILAGYHKFRTVLIFTTHVYMYVFKYMYIHMICTLILYTYVFIYMYIFQYVCKYMYIHFCVYLYICMHATSLVNINENWSFITILTGYHKHRTLHKYIHVCIYTYVLYIVYMCIYKYTCLC
jgi:hypothetical protein